MFDQVFDSMRRATEINVQMQQELFKRWAALWPGVPAAPGEPAGRTPSWAEQLRAFQKKWTEAVADVAKKQRETAQEQFNAGLKHIEQAFAMASTKDLDALRAQMLELWQKSFALLQQAGEAQVRDFQTAVNRFAEVFTPAA
jgi:hypothetical protein